MIANRSRHLPDWSAQVLRSLRLLAREREGVAAVEFALLVPIFVFLYLMSFQMTVGFSMANKVSRAASTIADLMTQQEEIDTDDLADMDELAKAIMAPYSTTGLTVKVTGLTLDSSGDATVSWSWKSDGTQPYATGLAVDVPADLQVADSFLVHAEVQTTYNYLFFVPYMTGSTTSSVNIYKDFYFRQRIGDGVACTNC